MNDQLLDLSRRGFLKGTALLAAASTLGFSGMFGLRMALAAAADDDIPTILNVAATAETFAVTHYYRALSNTTKAQFTAAQKAYLRAGLESEQDHLDFLNANGGKALTDKFYFPAGTFNDAKTFGTVSSIAETVFVGAYIAATHRFAQLGQPELAAIAAQVAVVEGQHLALSKEIAGAFPNDVALAAPVFYNVSDAVPVVQPLLDGKKGALGDMEKDAVSYPGKDKVMAAVGKSNLLAKLPAPFNTPIAPFAKQGGAAATMAPTTSS